MTVKDRGMERNTEKYRERKTKEKQRRKKRQRKTEKRGHSKAEEDREIQRKIEKYREKETMLEKDRTKGREIEWYLWAKIYIYITTAMYLIIYVVVFQVFLQIIVLSSLNIQTSQRMLEQLKTYYLSKLLFYEVQQRNTANYNINMFVVTIKVIVNYKFIICQQKLNSI